MNRSVKVWHQTGPHGLFARLALGGEAPTWYWMPLVPHGDTWMPGRITILTYRQ